MKKKSKDRLFSSLFPSEFQMAASVPRVSIVSNHHIIIVHYCYYHEIRRCSISVVVYVFIFVFVLLMVMLSLLLAIVVYTVTSVFVVFVVAIIAVLLLLL